MARTDVKPVPHPEVKHKNTSCTTAVKYTGLKCSKLTGLTTVTLVVPVRQVFQSQIIELNFNYYFPEVELLKEVRFLLIYSEDMPFQPILYTFAAFHRELIATFSSQMKLL